MNQRPLGPQPSALPDCATPRGGRESKAPPVRTTCEHMFAMEGDDGMLKCSRCGELKPVDDFAWRRKRRGQRDSHCRPCRSAYGKEHYAANRQRYIDQAQLVKQRVRLERTVLLLAFFRTHPCLDCGETDPVVLEFDHIGEKRFNVGEALLSRIWQAVVEEIEQCEVVCANCHRRRTARRRRSVRVQLTE